MDLLDHVREIGAEQQLTSEQEDRVRAQLMEVIAAQTDPATAKPRGARRPAVWLGWSVGGVVAASAAVALTIGLLPGTVPAVSPTPPSAGSTTPPPSPSASPSAQVSQPPVVGTAAALLEQAAEFAPVSTGSNIVADGYLRIHRVVEQIVTYGPYEHSLYGVPGSPGTATAAWRTQQTWDIYVPADRSGQWVQVFPGDTRIIETYGPDADLRAQEWLAQAVRSPIVERYTGGLGYVEENGGPVRGSDAYFAEMPRDPAELTSWWQARIFTESPAESAETLVSVLIQDLELNAAPADLRATMFRALALQPGVHVISTEGPVTTIGFDFEVDDRYATMSLDTTTGLVVGSSTTRTPRASFIPPEIADYRVTVTTSPVSTAP